MGSLLAVILLSASCTNTTPKQFDSAGERLWSNETVPNVISDPDKGSVEVGTEFTVASDGVITAARFYQGPENTGAVTATVWTSDGTKIDTVPIPPGPGGWREVRFDRPVPVEADRSYVVSYRASRGHYSADPDTFAQGRTVESGWLTALRSVFTNGDGFPDQPGNANYYVDVVFESSGPTLRPVDGGERYYDGFQNSLPTSPDFFPVGVWYAFATTPSEVAFDRDLGLNTYVVLTADSNLQAIKNAGMYAITEEPNTLRAGQFTTDEADMWGGAGEAPWTGKTPPDLPTCIPEQAKCGFTVMAELKSEVPPQVMAFANYGKGVTFWEERDDAARFVNDFQDVVSVDNYWFTDNNICRADEGGVLKKNEEADLSDSECHLAANYGLSTKHVRSLVQPRASMPVWNFVEVGQPFAEEDDATITGPQLRAAVWSSIINGARGITYFSHSFGGPCKSYNLLRDQCGNAIRGDFAAVNKQIGQLAPVLNAPFVDGYARSDGPIDLAVKRYDGSNYLLVGSTRDAPADSAITLSCGNAESVEVIDENRTIPIIDRTFRDTFADGNAVHLYRINGTDGCGLP